MSSHAEKSYLLNFKMVIGWCLVKGLEPRSIGQGKSTQNPMSSLIRVLILLILLLLLLVRPEAN
jgi:hypothetical protein